MGHLQNVPKLVSIEPGRWKEPESRTFEVVQRPEGVQEPFIILRHHVEPSKFSYFQKRIKDPGPLMGCKMLYDVTATHLNHKKGTYPLHLWLLEPFLLIDIFLFLVSVPSNQVQAEGLGCLSQLNFYLKKWKILKIIKEALQSYRCHQNIKPTDI